MILALPLAQFVAVFLLIRSIPKGPLKLLLVDIDNEFGHFVEVMERIRASGGVRDAVDAIIVNSKYKFRGLADLYELEFNTRIWFRGGVRSLWQQVLLLQAPVLVSMTREVRGSPSWMSQRRTPLRVSYEMVELRRSLLRELGFSTSKYVAMAVYSMQYDEERAPAQVEKSRILESSGIELASGVDYLKSQGLDVVLLGTSDIGRAHVPREIPRLAEFGSLGGPHEVALASECAYFWSDNVGALWLAAPFLKPVLVTNYSRIGGYIGESGVFHFVHYETLEGEPIRWSELFERRFEQPEGPLKDATAGRLRIVRNSPQEIVSVHHEMLARINNTYTESNEISDLRSRFCYLYEKYGIDTPTVSGVFLKRAASLID